MIITTLRTALYYIHNITFMINGILAAQKKSLHPSVQLLCGISSAFFGGIFLRDLVLLHLIPAVLDSPFEFASAVFIGLIIVSIPKNKASNKFLSCLLNTADLIGTAAFAATGYRRGLSACSPWWICFASGFVTACGGGMIAAAIRATSLKDILHFTNTLKENKTCYFYAALMSAAQGIACMDRDLSITVYFTAVIVGILILYRKTL